jgi:hypothetical protein
VKSFSEITRCMTSRFALPFAIALSLCSTALCNAQSSPAVPCSWPIEVTGYGKTNAFNPDTNATYWLMRVDTTEWKQMIVEGEYPTARFFSFTTYFQTGGAVDYIIDANLAPNPGSTNPFQPGSSSGPHNYSLTIDGSVTGSGNHIGWGNTQIAYVIYRIYVPDIGENRQGSVPLPAVTLVDANGSSYPTQVCGTASNSSTSISSDRLPRVDTLSAGGTTESDPAASSPTACPSTQSSPEVVTFIINSSHSGVFPNPVTTYAAARGLCSESGKVIVIRGKGAVYPNTYYGGSIFQPAIAGQIQMRYWSLCNNKQILPYAVVDCRADHATVLDSRGYYTYVLFPDDSATHSGVAPSWVPADATGLGWGDPSVIHDLLFRVMLPVPDFSFSGDYFPKGVFCDKQLYITQGWQACFAAAGITNQ